MEKTWVRTFICEAIYCQEICPEGFYALWFETVDEKTGSIVYEAEVYPEAFGD